MICPDVTFYDPCINEDEKEVYRKRGGREMTNYESYAKLGEKIGNIGIMYVRDVYGTYGRARAVYTPCRIMESELDLITDSLKLTIVLIGYGESPRHNVSVADLYLPSPINSKFHGDMVPVRTYFGLLEKEQGSNGAYFNYRNFPETRKIPAKEFKEMLEKNAMERLSFGFSKKDTKFDYDKIIFSGPCTIILWKDGTKTMARVSEGDAFDPEKGVAVCFMKKIMGHTETNKILRKAAESERRK